MYENNSVWLVPLVLAFLVFATKFYVREHAASIISVSFGLAFLCLLVLLSYTLLTVLSLQVPYLAFGYGMGGVALLVLAVLMFRG